MHCDPDQTRFTRRADPLLPRRSPWLALLSQVMALAQGQGQLLRHAERGWTSATFTGSRHVIEMEFTGSEAIAAGEHYIRTLPDHEFAVPGHLVADATIIETDHTQLPQPRLTITAELLLLEDA
ncbi:hypothetical protein [Novosphingobium colocasiae]|uniref:hypothetical protein n=1 Tax=Novosphingobium colocasiae TaxID=1256513 RepID=UPI0035B20C6F